MSMRRMHSPTAAGRSEGSSVPVGSKVVAFSMSHLSWDFSIICSPFSSCLRSVSAGFAKERIQLFVGDSAPFYGVAKGRENFVKRSLAMHFSLDEFLNVTLHITAFGSSALFKERFNFGLKFECYCHSYPPLARRFFLHSEMFFNRRRNSASETSAFAGFFV